VVWRSASGREEMGMGGWTGESGGGGGSRERVEGGTEGGAIRIATRWSMVVGGCGVGMPEEEI